MIHATIAGLEEDEPVDESEPSRLGGAPGWWARETRLKN